MDKEKTKDYTEEFEGEKEIQESEEVNDIDVEQIDETRESRHHHHHHHHHKDKKKIILIIITIILVIAAIGCILYLTKHKKQNDNNKPDNTPKIVRPSDDIEYVVLKQNYFSMSCKKTRSGDKIKKLSKGMIIECEFGYELSSNQKLTELYFDINNSSNIKLANIRNNSKFELTNENKTYMLIPDEPTSTLDKLIKFDYEVLNDDDTAYIELNNVVFKDVNNKYYKVINSIETFPVEYDDKIYIYKATYEEDDTVYYYSSKTKNTEDTLFDTFQCQNEDCMTLAESTSNFLIKDDGLLVYNSERKTSQALKLKDDFKLDGYSYEMMSNQKGSLYGIMFKKNYQSQYECGNSDSICINKGLSGYEMGYYSLKANMFTIDPSLNIIGAGAYQDYDLAILLKKDNTFGVFSLEDDDMVIKFSDKYKSIDFDDYTSSIVLEVYDDKNGEYYFEYFDPITSSYTIKTDNLRKFDNSTIYYATEYNRDKKEVTMLFDSKGNPIKNMPYVLTKKLVKVNSKIIIDATVNYVVYDLNGNYLYETGYADEFILGYTKNYLIAASEDSKLQLLDNKGKFILDIRDLNDGNKFVSVNEEDGSVIVVIKDSSITEENKNAYQYTIKNKEIIDTQTIQVN